MKNHIIRENEEYNWKDYLQKIRKKRKVDSECMLLEEGKATKRCHEKDEKERRI